MYVFIILLPSLFHCIIVRVVSFFFLSLLILPSSLSSTLLICWIFRRNSIFMNSCDCCALLPYLLCLFSSHSWVIIMYLQKCAIVFLSIVIHTIVSSCVCGFFWAITQSCAPPYLSLYFLTLS